MFDSILNDREIIKKYEDVTKAEIENKGWAYHNLKHILNVCEIVVKMLVFLNYDEEFIECAKIACLLHDTGVVDGKDGHAERSYIFAKDYLKRKNIKLKYEDLVLDAIKNHSNGFDTDNVIGLCLIFADKLDIKSNRITEEGKKVIGNRQYQYILDIKIYFDNDNIIINFITSCEFDKDEVEEFYFTSKTFNAIKAFCSKFKLNPIVLLNGIEWEMFNNI